MEKNHFLTPFKLNGKVTIKNRLVLAPMTTTQNNHDGSVSDAEIKWLESIALGGIGMLITGGAAISSDIAFENQLSVAEDKILPGLTKLIEHLRPHSSVNILQVMHGGTRSRRDLSGCTNYGVSAYQMPSIPNFKVPIPYTIQQINEIVRDFSAAAKRAWIAGFDGIEVHGANGYLITQFLSQMTNLREDKYGGELEGRARLAREIIRGCKGEVPSDFIIGVRLTFENSGLETGLDIDEIIQVANWLIEDGIDYIHCSSIDSAAKSVKYPNKGIIQYIREKIPNIPLISVGGVTSVEGIQSALCDGADLVACGRSLIGNPEFINRLTGGQEILKTPYTIEHLKKLNISEEFIKYMSVQLNALKIVQ